MIRRILAVLFVLLGPSTAVAAVAYINTNTDLRAASASSLSGAQTCTNTGSNLVAVARVAWSDNTDVNGVTVTDITFGGTAMVSVHANLTYNFAANQWLNVQLFTLAAPPTGSQTLSITLSASQKDIYADIACFNGADQTTPVRAGSYTEKTDIGASSLDVTIAIPSNANDYTVDVLSWRATTATSNQTQDNKDTAGTLNYASARAVGAATVTHTWTLVTTTPAGALAGFSISGGTVPARLLLGVGR